MLIEAEDFLRDFRRRTAPLAPPSANDRTDFDDLWDELTDLPHDHPRGLL